MHLLLALLAALPDGPPAREKASSFTFVRPKDWIRQDVKANNTVVLAPPGAAGAQCSLTIFPGQNGELNELVFHGNLFQAITQGSQIDGQIDRAYRGSWQYSRVKIITPQKQPSWMILYTTKVDTRLEGMLLAAASEEALKANRFAVEKMITGIEFPGARPPPPGGPEWSPAPVPDRERDVKILGAWLVARMETVFSVDPKAGGVHQEQTVKVIALFENNVAAKVDARQTGLLDSTYPAEGLATMNVSNPAALAKDRRYGRWSEADGKIKIQWNQGPEDNVVRVKDDLKGGDVLWSALKPVDGLKLDGTYVREMPFGPPGMITLRKDGTFDQDQVNETMGGKLVNKKFPEMGSGTYEFRKWSLILRFDTGFVQSIHAEFDGADPAASKILFINGYTFERSGAPPSGGATTPAAAAVATTIQGLVIPLPPDWIRKDDPSANVYLFPPQAQNPRGWFLVVLPSNGYRGTPWAAHKSLLQIGMGWWQLADGTTVTHVPDGPGIFIRSDVSGKTAAGESREFRLFTAVHDGSLEAVMAVGGADPAAVEPILRGTTFKDPPRPAVRPKIVEAYRRVKQNERIWLRSDGTADFTPWYAEGYAASPLALKLDPGLEDGPAGSWKAVGDKVQIVRKAGSPPDVYERDGGALRLGDATWEPMPRVDGLRLSGRWALAASGNGKDAPSNAWIELTEDGKFRCDGLLARIAEQDRDGSKPPEKCEGTYEIRDWTIFLKLSNGSGWSTDFSTIGRDPKDLSAILFRAFRLQKE